MLVEKELNWLSAQHIGPISKVEKFTNALTNDVYAITRQDKQRFIFKRLNREARTDADRKAELCVQQLAFQHGLTPKVLACSEDYKLQQYIEGQLIPEQHSDISHLLAEQLYLIHQLPAQHAPTQRLVLELERLKQQLPVAIDESCFQKMLELAAQLDASSACDTLCHGDLSLNNILLGDDQRVYILDWEYAVIACAAYDLAFCNCINGFSQAESQAVIENYYAQLSDPKPSSLNSLQKECQLYFELFSYINELWALCFVDND